MKLIRPALNPAYAQSAFAFHQACATKPFYPLPLLERFFNRLISSSENIVEVWSGNEKLAAAVLIDEISNPHSSANAELLGFRSCSSPQQVLALIFAEFAQLIQKRRKHSAVIASHHATLPFPKVLFPALGFSHFYDTYELATHNPHGKKLELNSAFRRLELEEARFEEYYLLLRASFAQNPEASIGTLEDMRQGFHKRKLPILVVEEKQSGRLAGFVTLFFDEAEQTGEINTIGVHPDFRGSGIGRFLLHAGMDCLWGVKPKSVHLTASTTNKNALRLYLHSGFTVEEEFTSYRRIL